MENESRLSILKYGNKIELICRSSNNNKLFIFQALTHTEPIDHSPLDSTVQTVTPSTQVSSQQQQSSITQTPSIEENHPNDLPPPPSSLTNITNSQHSMCCAECPTHSTNIPNSSQNTTLSHLRFQNRIDVDCETESNHDTALTLSCAGGHEELVTLLLQRGANIEHRDKKGFTPLILAGISFYFLPFGKTNFLFL
jgi:ankyrin repeat protein